MAGIKTLFNLLLKDSAKKSGQYSGIMSIGDSVRKLAEKRLQTFLAAAKKQGVDLDKLSEDELKYMLKLNEQPKVISADSPEGKGIMDALLGKKRGKIIRADFGKPFAEEVKKFRGPVKATENIPGFGKLNVEIDYSASLDKPEFFGNAKNMYGEPAGLGSEFFKEKKQFHLNQINRKKKEMVSRNHPNYKLLKKSLQDQEDSLTAAQIAEELGGNENMYNFLRQKQIYDLNAKPLKKSDYIKGADDLEDMAQGGRAGFANGTGAPSIKYDFDKKQEPMGPEFETDDPKEAVKEILRRLIRIDPEQIPISKNVGLIVGTNPSIGIGGEIPLFGGGLKFGAGKDVTSGEEQFDFRFGKGLNNGSLELGVGKNKEGIGGGLTLRKKFNQGGRAGFFLGGKGSSKGLGLLREILKYSSKKGQETGNLPANLSALDMLRLSNPKAFNKMLKDAEGKINVKEGIMGTDSIKALQQETKERRKGLVERTLDVARALKAQDDEIAKRIAEENKKTTIPKVKKDLMESMGMSEERAQKMAESMAEATSKMRPLNAPPEVTEEGILQLENILKNMETGGKPARDLNADGGRIGFKEGMSRRTFLKIFGGLVSLPIIGKIVKPLKLTTGVKKVPIIKTDNVPGKPEWFDQLVNKVIVEGDDVTKRFATGERQSIHQKKLDDGSVVRVTEDVDQGAVRVEYESKTNPYEETTQLEYKKPLPDEGAPSPTAEFSAAESGPYARSDSARLDFEKEIEEFATGNVDELVTDFSKLKEYATGKKPTMREIVEAKKKKDQAKKLTEGDFDAEYELMEQRQGLPFYDEPLPDDFASGGIARMLGE